MSLRSICTISLWLMLRPMAWVMVLVVIFSLSFGGGVGCGGLANGSRLQVGELGAQVPSGRLGHDQSANIQVG